jgi:hypothetical protein
MTPELVAAQLARLREQGVVLLRGVFPKEPLVRLRRAAHRCFRIIEGGSAPAPERYGFNSFSGSVLVSALEDFGCALTPLAVAGLDDLLTRAMGCALACKREQCWIRKKYAPSRAPAGHYPNRWHQDGGLGVHFPQEPGPALPLTPLVTCWIPLHSCGQDRPGLEFVRRRLDVLLHYTELDDALLRQRFPAADFWRPVLKAGDGLVFLNGSLHRTHVDADMRRDRLSVEYRFFPA